MKIAVYCQDGSPLGVTPHMINGRGVGGAELSMMTWAETMAQRGHDVSVYNNPKGPIGETKVTYKNKSEFNPAAPVDVFIVYRSPNDHIENVNARLKIHWSTDQQTIGDYARDIVPYVDGIVCISPFHEDYYLNRYRPPKEKICHINLGVRLSDYYTMDMQGRMVLGPKYVEVKRNPKQFIFCSVPQRGLMQVAQIWPRILALDPECELVITSDYTLWGVGAGNANERARFMGLKNVHFLGKVPRPELAKYQLESGVHLYPCTYEELFCISVAETQAAGCIPITSDLGAMATTNLGEPITGNPENNGRWHEECVHRVAEYLLDLESQPETIVEKRKSTRNLAASVFNWPYICDQWESLFGQLLEEKEETNVGSI